MSQPPPLPRPAGWLARFAEGFSTPWSGLRYMNAHPALWRHGILPIICNLLLSAALFAGLIWGWFATYDWLDARFPANWWGNTLEVLSVIAVAALEIALAVAAWIVFQGIFCGFFYSRLAREVEIQLGLAPDQMREVPLIYQVTDALLDLAALTAVAIGCFAIGWIPLVGAPLAVGLGLYFDCFVFGMDYLDYPQALRARGRSVQRRFARRHRAHTLGLGTSVMLITFVPLLSPVLLTTAATGAVLLYRKLEAPDT
ncbi:MAG TPA: EI24 domain-containing protein [Opitutaceae bacterium]|nr:EI24 domain-containing protein [Opitutaceae bacterium]